MCQWNLVTLKAPSPTKTAKKQNMTNQPDNESISGPTEVNTSPKIDNSTSNDEVDHNEEEEEGVSVVEPQPLWPKTLDEYGWAMLDMGIIGMVVAGLTGGECPAIPTIQGFLISFAVVTMTANGLKFFFSLRRPNQDKIYPRVKILVDVLGLAQLAIGIWGMALIFPNLGYLSDPSPDTCEMGPLIATLIPAFIIAVVIVILFGMLILHLLGYKLPSSQRDGAGTVEEKSESTRHAHV